MGILHSSLRIPLQDADRWLKDIYYTSSPSFLSRGADTKAKFRIRSCVGLLMEASTNELPELTLLTLAWLRGMMENNLYG